MYSYARWLYRHLLMGISNIDSRRKENFIRLTSNRPPCIVQIINNCWEPLKTPDSALRACDKMLIYLIGRNLLRPYIFVAGASLDFEVFRGSLFIISLLHYKIPQ
jgi:hypothetical protein